MDCMDINVYTELQFRDSSWQNTNFFFALYKVSNHNPSYIISYMFLNSWVIKFNNIIIIIIKTVIIISINKYLYDYHHNHYHHHHHHHHIHHIIIIIIVIIIIIIIYIYDLIAAHEPLSFSSDDLSNDE